MKRFIIGRAYNKLIADSESTKTHTMLLPLQVEAALAKSSAARTALFNRPDVRIPVGVGADDTWMRNMSLMREHDVKAGPVGRILSSRIEGNDLHVVAEVTDPATIAELDAGRLRGLSVSYVADPTVTGPKRFRFSELSLCERPRFEGCGISVVASRDADTASNKSATYLGTSDGSTVLSSSLHALLTSTKPMSTPNSAPAGGSIETPTSNAAAGDMPVSGNVPPTSGAEAAGGGTPAAPNATPAAAPSALLEEAGGDEMDFDLAGGDDLSTENELAMLKKQNNELQQQMTFMQAMIRQDQKPNIDAVQNMFRQAMADSTTAAANVELPPTLQKILSDHIFSDPRMTREREAFVRLAHYQNGLLAQVAEIDAVKKNGVAELRKSQSDVKRLTEENAKLRARMEKKASVQSPSLPNVFGIPSSMATGGRPNKRSRTDYEMAGIDPFAAAAKPVAVNLSADPSPSSSSGLPDRLQQLLNEDDTLTALQNFPSEPLTGITLSPLFFQK